MKDYGTLMAGCLRAKGWDAKATIGSAFSVDLRGQSAALAKDEITCRSKLGFVSPGKPSAQQVSDYYAAQLKVRTCLIDHGVALAAPPSKQTFVETFDTAKQWNPYVSVGQTNAKQWDYFNTVCPQAIP